MSTLRNAGTEPVAFRDDAGKHIIPPGETFDVVGAQHLAHVRSLPGVEPATVPAKAPKVDRPRVEPV